MVDDEVGRFLITNHHLSTIIDQLYQPSFIILVFFRDDFKPSITNCHCFLVAQNAWSRVCLAPQRRVVNPGNFLRLNPGNRLGTYVGMKNSRCAMAPSRELLLQTLSINPHQTVYLSRENVEGYPSRGAEDWRSNTTSLWTSRGVRNTRGWYGVQINVE